jgi:bifunctional non-homologous end joining protein LigD
VLASVRLAEERAGGLHPVGGVGTGFSVASARNLKPRLDAFAIDKPPIAKVRGTAMVWAPPEIGVELEYRARTSDGYLRHPSFRGIQTD